MAMIVLDKVGMRFGNVDAVISVSLEIEKGEFVSLLGPSGCGKTTTLRMIAGFEESTSGSIYIDGKDVSRVPIERRGIGMVFQNYALFPHLNVFENIAFGLRLRGEKGPALEDKVKQALAQVGLSGLEKRLPAQMSGGQQQRVSLARALVVNPSVLLMDEPLSNLDLKLREQMRDEIRDLQRSSGITAVFVTHDQGEAMAMSDRIAVMNAGRIEQVGRPREIYEQPATSFVASFIGQCNLLTGKAAPSGGTFRSSAGLEFRIAGKTAAEGANMCLAIRSEEIKVACQDEAPPETGRENAFSAAVRDVVYLGETAILTLSVPAGDGGTEILKAAWTMAPGKPLPQRGEAVRIFIPADRCHLVIDSGRI